MMLLYPTCREIGAYFPLAVTATENGASDAVILNKTQNKYHKGTFQTISLLNFLKKKIKRDLIDHLWIDNEGIFYDF